MKLLTSLLLLLLLWVYWQAANNFTAYTATRSPGRKSPELGTGFSRSCCESSTPGTSGGSIRREVVCGLPVNPKQKKKKK